MPDKLNQLKSFFARPGINKSGICRELGISRRYMDQMLSGERVITDQIYERFLEVAESYGGVPEKGNKIEPNETSQIIGELSKSFPHLKRFGKSKK